MVLNFQERMTVALMRASMTKEAFARYVGVSKVTVWRWETLRDEPKIGALRVLAAESGFPVEWLRPSDDEIAEGRSKYAPWDLNPEPTD